MRWLTLGAATLPRYHGTIWSLPEPVYDSETTRAEAEDAPSAIPAANIPTQNKQPLQRLRHDRGVTP